MQTFSMDLGGRTLTIETGRVAKQAGGSVIVTYGETVVLVAATGSASPREGIDFFPLTCDYEERLYAVGKIPGNWFRREGRPTSKAILTSRLIDRPIRPLFPEGFRNDVQVVATVLSVDGENPPEICGMIGASAALAISDIPFNGPIGAVIVGLVDGNFVCNPNQEQADKSAMHLVVAGTKDAIMMVEAGAQEVPEEVMLEAIAWGHEQVKNVVALIERMQAEVGKTKREMVVFSVDTELEAAIRTKAAGRIREAMMNSDKLNRENAIDTINREVKAELAGSFPDKEKEMSYVLKKILKEEVRSKILNDGVRPDGRHPREVRPVTCEVGVLPRTHGTGLFTRGQTQVMTVCTLGTTSDIQELDDLSNEETKRYLHHYNFPSYSVGETRPMRGPGRREIGHGALAERALEPMIPPESEFPYTIRLVSEVLESNGSTSMGSVCGSTLALMDAGVPLKSPVSGVAMGLIKEGDRVQVLTDIQGLEDFLGDMDFKVAGTAAGITALQMDMKISGVDRAILQKALDQAREGRMHILEKMLSVLPAPRQDLSPHAPRIITMRIHPDKIREVIGPGGKMINKIIEETKVGNQKVDISIEDDGTIYIASVNSEAGAKAVGMIEALVKEVAVGEIYTGRVTRLMNFGAFVEILPGKEGMIHISHLAEGRVAKVEDAVNVGDTVTVKVIEIDKMGRINLSRKEILKTQRPAAETVTGVGNR